MKIETQYLRPKKAAMLRERYAMYDEFAEARITEVENGMVLPAYIDSLGDVISGVVDSNGAFVADSHMVDFPDEVACKACSMDCGRSDDTAVYLGLFNPHWGHFITDCLSTFWFLDAIDADKYIFSYYEGRSPEICPNIRMALQFLGVWDKIEFVAEARSYRKVFVPRKGMVPRDYVLKESARVYDKIIARGLEECPANEPAIRKVLLSRAHFGKAVLNDLGTTRVEDVFVRNGFVAVYPEEMTLAELIRCLHGAERVVAVSGTLTHNMLFAPSGSELIVIEKYANINNYQQGIDRLRDLRATYIDAGYLIWSVDPGLGPFIMGATPELRRYAVDNGLTFDLTEPAADKTLRRYFTLFYRHYKRSWVLPGWLEVEIGLLREAYEASLPVFGEWLDGSRPIFVSDFLRPRFLAKTILRRFISIVVAILMAVIGARAESVLTVADAGDRTPVVGASVIAGNGLILGFTDGAGAIAVSARDYPLSVRCLGYEAATVDAPCDTAFLQDAVFALPEMVVSTAGRPISRVVTFGRGYCTSASGGDTLHVYGEFMVEYFLADGKVKGYKSHDRFGRTLAERICFHNTNVEESDSALRDQISILTQLICPSSLPRRQITETEAIRSGARADTVQGKYYPEAVYRKNDRFYTVEKDMLADSKKHTQGFFLFKLLGFNIEFNLLEGRDVYGVNDFGKYDITDYLCGTRNIRLLANGKFLKKFFRKNTDIVLNIYIEQYPVSFEHLSVEDYKEMRSEGKTGREEFRMPDYVLPLAPPIQELADRLALKNAVPEKD